MIDNGCFDLSNKNDVKASAPGIYLRVTDKSMPMQIPPWTQKNPDPEHPLWTEEICNSFKAWMDAGYP